MGSCSFVTNLKNHRKR